MFTDGGGKKAKKEVNFDQRNCKCRLRPDELLTEQNKSDPDLDLDSLDLEQTPEFGVYDEDEDNISRTTPKPTSWPWSKFTTEKNEDFPVEGNDEWDDDTEALPYKVLEKRFVST